MPFSDIMHFCVSSAKRAARNTLFIARLIATIEIRILLRYIAHWFVNRAQNSGGNLKFSLFFLQSYQVGCIKSLMSEIHETHRRLTCHIIRRSLSEVAAGKECNLPVVPY